MVRESMFEIKQGSLPAPNPDEESLLRDLPKHELKARERRLRIGKVRGSVFEKPEQPGEHDVIPVGEHYTLTREHDDQTVVLKGLSRDDCEALEKDHLLRSFDQEDILHPVIQATAKKWFEFGPTTIQKYVIPCIALAPKDVVARAKTGSGKMAAYLLPIISRIIEDKKGESDERQKQTNSDSPYALVFLPTRELVLQTTREARRLAKGTNVTVAFSFGTIHMADTYRMMKQGADIVIGTPSRLDHLFEGIESTKPIDGEYGRKIGACFNYNNLRYLVLDEADRLLENAEFCTHIVPIKNRLKNVEHRTFMFSATDTDLGAGSKELFVSDPIEIIVGGDEAPVRNVLQSFVPMNSNHLNPVMYKDKYSLNCPLRKIDYLLFLLDRLSEGKVEDGYRRVPPTIVFVQTRRGSDAIAICLIREGFRAASLNADHPMETRAKTLERMQKKNLDVLVATDVAARGLNVPGVDTVINFDLPASAYVNYIHRIGRTGRMGNIGRAISFFDQARDHNMAFFLAKCLQSNGQEVPAFLHEISIEAIDSTERILMKELNSKAGYVNGLPPHRSVLDPDVTF